MQIVYTGCEESILQVHFYINLVKMSVTSYQILKSLKSFSNGNILLYSLFPDGSVLKISFTLRAGLLTTSKELSQDRSMFAIRVDWCTKRKIQMTFKKFVANQNLANGCYVTENSINTLVFSAVADI